MNEKLYKEELRNILKREYGMSEKGATDALNKFFALMAKALEQERYVKVKGLGVFKLIDVDSRRSVDVNTGESIEIPEHRKISYSVDASLKELINKPFAHFEAIELKQETSVKEEDVEKEGQSLRVEKEIEEDNIGELVDTKVGAYIETEEELLEVEPQEENTETEVGMDENTESSDGKLMENEETIGGNSISSLKEQMRRKLISRRENWRELESEIEKEERSNRMILLTISLFMVLLMLIGLLFILAPEFLEKVFY